MTHSSDRAGLPAIPDGHLDWLEVTAVLILFTTSKGFLTFEERVARAAQTAAWSVPVFSALLSVAWLWPLVAVLRAHPRMNLIDITERLAGRVVAILLGLAFSVYMIGVAVTDTDEISHALNASVMPRTPHTVVLIAILAAALYLSLKGTEVIGRFSLFVVVPLTAALLILAALTIPTWEIKRVFPLLGPGALELSKTYFIRQAMFGEMLGLGFICVYLRKPEQTGKVARWTAVLSTLVLAVTVFTTQVSMPYPTLVRQTVPYLRLARLIYLNRFFQRVDALFVAVWLGDGIMKTAIAAYTASLAMATILRLRTYKPLLVATAVVVGVTAHMIPSQAETIVLNFDIVRPYSVILLYLWPWLLVLLGIVRRGQESAEAATR